MTFKFAVIFCLIVLGNGAVAAVANVLDANATIKAVAICLAAVVGGAVIGGLGDQLPDFSRSNDSPRRSETRR